jgi:ribulose-phosphate 3-epimerase
MDGHFVPNISFGPALVQSVRERTRLPLDIHLMITDPDKHVEAFAQAGGTTLVFHMEANVDPAQLIQKIHDMGVGAGAALRPETSYETVTPWIDRLEQILVMSVHPGFSGQRFIDSALSKVRAARNRIDALGNGADVSIDGGVTPETAFQAAQHGATFFVCGNSVFNHRNVSENLRDLRKSVTEGAGVAVR